MSALDISTRERNFEIVAGKVLDDIRKWDAFCLRSSKRLRVRMRLMSPFVGVASIKALRSPSSAMVAPVSAQFVIASYRVRNMA
jgi:hypothetical protein